MKKCKTVKGLAKAIKSNVSALLPVYDIMTNYFSSGGAYLNLGCGKYSYVDKENWIQIRNNVVSADNHNRYYKDNPRYQSFFK